MQQIIFLLTATILVIIALGVVFRVLFFSDQDQVSAQQRLEALQQEYRILQDRRRQQAISSLSFVREERDLIARVLQLREDAARKKDSEQQKKLALGAFVFCLVAVPLTCMALYGWYGDFSALSRQAQEQLRYTQTAAQSQKSMADTMAQLERTVQETNDRDNLDAWEILADYYYQNNDLHKAEKAYREVLRLNEADVQALANLADILLALHQGALTPEVVSLNRKTLILDPWQDKSLLLAGIIALENENYADAVVYWGRLRNMTAAGSELYNVLDTNIRAALKVGHMAAMPYDEYAHKPADFQIGGIGTQTMPQNRL